MKHPQENDNNDIDIRWRFSSVGRASALQAEGQRFEPVNLHHYADLAQSGRATDL